MMVLKFDETDRMKELKKEIAATLEQAKSFVLIVLTNSGADIEFVEYNMSNHELISSCEVVKTKILNRVVVE